MTTSRQLVKQSLEFEKPARVPRNLWCLPWAEKHHPVEVQRICERFPDDFAGAPGFRREPLRITGDQYAVGVYIDEWGCTFQNLQEGVIGEVKHPLVANWSDLDKMRPPEEALSMDQEQVNAYCRSTDRFVTCERCANPFERMQYLRGSQNLYYDLADPPAEFFSLLERVHQHFIKELEQWARTEVDALNIMDDWGSQRALLISPVLWRRIFKPLYKDYIDLAHSHGKYAFMHTDGYTADIIPDLIDLGLDALNAQLFTMDIEELGRKHRGRLTFWGEIDRQYLLSFASPAEVDEAVRRVSRALWQDGGCIAQCEFSAGGKPENVWQVFETWEKVLDQ